MSERGFTLLEVLVALIVFALTFGALAAIFSTGFRQSRSAERTIEASLTAQSLLNRIGNEARIEPGRFGDKLDNGFRFEAVIEPWRQPDPDFEVVLFAVDLVVFEAGDGPEHGVRLSTLRLRAADREP